MSKVDVVDHDLRVEFDRASKRLFFLFSEGCEEEKWILKAYWAYKLRLLYRHRWEG